jgi:glycosyltransferase involved in cell wall biosynthesis
MRGSSGSSVVNDAALRIAIVTPWYGSDLTGGAERTAWQMGHGLAERTHDVTVYTTCARDFAGDWGVDVHRPGMQREDGITVWRYAVDARDRNAFDRANEVLLSQSPAFYARHAHAIGDEIAEAFVRHSINSERLIAALRAEAAGFDAVIVLPYPYGLSIAAVHAAGDRAMLVPCLHDETYAYLPAVEGAFRAAAVLGFNTLGERRLAYRIFGPAISLKSVLVGQWVDAVAEPTRSIGTSNGRGAHPQRYLLYAGRRDETKNVDMLVESFATFRRRERMSALELVLIGPGRRSYSDSRHGIIDLGEVDDARKQSLLSGAWVVVQPSVNESFSRVVNEAWSVGTPVAVNARCEATAEAVLECGGGWTAATKAQWSALFHDVDRMAESDRTRAGARGQLYVEDHTAREKVLARLEAALASVRRAARTRFDAVPQPTLLRRLNDGRRTVLFAGPLVETAGIEQLLTGFAFLLSLGVDAQLALLGSFDPDESLSERFFELIATAALGDRVFVLEATRPEIAAACFRSADLYWSMAEDGPEELVDALGYGVPVFAFANPRSTELLASSGLLFSDKQDQRALAGVAALLMTDDDLAETLADGQRRRFEELHRCGDLRLTG